MEKIRLGVYAFGIVIVGILVFTLSKSWFILDRGVELVEPGSSKEEPLTPADRSGDLLNHSVVLWERYLFYPFELSRETVAGHRKTLNHARNLTVVDLESGNPRKLFHRNVYIWDYFTGTDVVGNTTEESELDSVLASGISTGKNLILIGMTEDTNKDGFLNQKDRKQVFCLQSCECKSCRCSTEKIFFGKISYISRKRKIGDDCFFGRRKRRI